MQRDYEKLIELILREIEAKGLSIKQVSALTGVSVPTISWIVHGKTPNPHANTIMKLANGLGIPKSEIRKAAVADGTD